MTRTPAINHMSEMNDQCLTSKATFLNLLGDQCINLCLTYAMASVSTSDLEVNIDANVSALFTVSPSVEYHSSPSSDVAFVML